MAWNSDRLAELLMEAEEIIRRSNAGEEIDYETISDLIGNLSINPVFEERSRDEGSHELHVLARLQEIRDPPPVRDPRYGMRYNAARAAAGAGNEAWVRNTSKGGRRKTKKTRKANKSRKRTQRK